MFSQLVFVRLRAAEAALRDGRLDEAYRLASAPDLRGHRRSAAVLAALTQRFLERARSHFRADRFSEALMDIDRAEAGGVMKDEVAELRSNIKTVAAEDYRRNQDRRQRLKAAAKRIEDGSLAAGRDMLERASDGDHAARQLRRAAEERAHDASTIVAQADALLGQGQLAAAADRLRRAKAVDAHHTGVASLEAALCRKVLEAARTAFTDGRPSRCTAELACLQDLGTSLPARRELNDALSLAAEAAACVQANQYGEARRHVMSLARLLPEAAWIESAMDQLRQVDDIRTALCAGPLGERINAPNITVAAAPKPASLDDTVALGHRVVPEGALPERLLLLVDGGGSYLLLRNGRASIGRAAGDALADVPIFSDLAEHHAEIARIDDDYFLLSARDVEVAGKLTKHGLLRDGDRVVLGRKAKLTFRLPSRKSPTAILDLSDTTKMPRDVRRIILFQHHAAVGGGETAHIRCRHAGASLILFERNGSLWIRRQNDGHGDVQATQLRLGEPAEIGGVSLVLGPWQTGSTVRNT